MIANETCVRFAIRDLPVDVQNIIVAQLRETPNAPIKSKRLEGFMKRWSDPTRPRVLFS